MKVDEQLFKIQLTIQRNTFQISFCSNASFVHWGVLLLWLSWPGNVVAQIKSDTNAELLNWHDKQVGIYNLGILNGPFYEFKKTSLKTHQFLVTPAWEIGSVEIKGQEYHELLVVYDLSEECLVLKHPDPNFKYGIRINDVKAFHIHNLKFIWLDESFGNPGYYNELLIGNHLGLYAKRLKKERAAESGGTTYRELTFYYVLYKGELLPYHNLKSIYDFAPDKKNLVKQLKKEANLHPSVKREEDLVRLITILDQNEEFIQ